LPLIFELEIFCSWVADCGAVMCYRYRYSIYVPSDSNNIYLLCHHRFCCCLFLFADSRCSAAPWFHHLDYWLYLYQPC